MNWSPLWISLEIAIPATILTFFLGILVAQKNRKLPHKIAQIIDVVLTLPLVLPPTVVGFLLLLLFGKNGFLGGAFFGLGIKVVFTRTAAVIAAIAVSFPLMYRSAKAAFEQVDQNLIYAARTLKMNEISIFWRIIMPAALPGVISGSILSFARALGEFGATLMVAGNIPDKTQTMPLAIYMSIQGGEDTEAIRWVLILVLISFFMILLMNYFTIQEKKGRR